MELRRLTDADEQAIAVAHARLTRWMDQGCPTRGPVVVHVGRLIVNPDGTRLVTDWGWDFNFFEGPPLAAVELWNFLAARHPEALRRSC